jgi:hypothetical protein
MLYFVTMLPSSMTGSQDENDTNLARNMARTMTIFFRHDTGDDEEDATK